MPKEQLIGRWLLGGAFQADDSAGLKRSKTRPPAGQQLLIGNKRRRGQTATLQRRLPERDTPAAGIAHQQPTHSLTMMERHSSSGSWPSSMRMSQPRPFLSFSTMSWVM